MASEEDIVFKLGVSGSDTVISALNKVDSKMKDIAARDAFGKHVKEIEELQKKIARLNLSTWAGRIGFDKSLNDLSKIRRELEIINGLTSKNIPIHSYASTSKPKTITLKDAVKEITDNNPVGGFIRLTGSKRNKFVKDLSEVNSKVPLLGDGSSNGNTGFTMLDDDSGPTKAYKEQSRRNARIREEWKKAHRPASEEVIDMDMNGNSVHPRRVKIDEYGNPITGNGIRWNRSLVPFGANSGPSWDIPEPKQGLFSGAGGFRGGLMAAMMKNPITAGIAIFLIGLNSALKLFKKITHAIGMMNEAWKVHVTSHYSGSSSDDVQGIGAALMPYGGNYETAAGTLRKFRTTLQNMRVSGEGGGALEEASVRYGLNILGTEPGGLARPEELLGRIAKLMETLTTDQKVGLADTLGLDKATYELLAHGEENYNQKIKGSQTLLGSIMGYHGAYTESEQTNSKIGNEAWNSFLVVLKETGGIIIDAVIPAFTILMDFLSGLFQAINLVLKPISAFINLITKLFSTRFWNQIFGTASGLDGSNPDSDNPTNRNVSYSVTINKVDVNAPSANSAEVANEFNKNIVSTMTSAIKANDNGILG